MEDNKLFMELVDNAIEMVLVFNQNGIITYSNNKVYELLEYDNKVEGCSICEIFPVEFSVKNGELAANTELDGKSKSMMAYRQNRTCFSVEARIREYEDQYLCMALDTSKQEYFEKKATQFGEERKEAEQVKTQFVANVTHELRTPVNGILGNVRELAKIETDGEKKRLLALVERGCNDMHSIINNILDFSKLNAGKFTLEARVFNFREMMDYIKSTHINKISEKGLKFFMTVSPEIPENIIGDDLRIQQVLNNLLSNATKFTYVGKIMVEVVKTAQIDNRIELFFMVIDSGIGIAKEDQHKLFKSFSQVEASTTRKFGGTGLGLNISKQIVELMDGSIHVESEKNKGTMFSFHIWVDVPKDEVDSSVNIVPGSYTQSIPSLEVFTADDEIHKFGTKDNLDEIQKKMSKLILCVEMDNWEKAEWFMESIKSLTEEAPKEVKSAILRLKMSVQKADYDKASNAYSKLKDMLFSEKTGLKT